MLLRWTAFTLWALVAASAIFWGLRLFVQPQPVPAGTVVAVAEAPLRGDLTRLLGAEPAPAQAPPVAAADPRFQLLGVLSPRDSRADSEGVALIAVDDRPPRAYRVGMVVDGDTVLQAVHPRGARLGPSGGLTLVALELPPPAAAATGALPAVPGAARTGAAGAKPGAAGPAGTQIFMPPGQPSPNFTRLRNAAPPVTPVPLTLPAPPPELQQPQDAGAVADEATLNADTVDPGEAQPNQMPNADLNPIR